MINISRIRRIKARVPILQFPINLDIGCAEGSHRKAGYIGLDINDYGQEIVWDLEVCIPLPNNSCQNINATQVFEHVEDFVGVMNECHRVLKPDGQLFLTVPHKDHEKAYIPSHIRRFDKYTFDFFQYPEYADEYGGSLWEVLSLEVKNGDIHVAMKPKK